MGSSGEREWSQRERAQIGNMLRTMGAQFLAIRDRSGNIGKEKTRISPVELEMLI